MNINKKKAGAGAAGVAAAAVAAIAALPGTTNIEGHYTILKVNPYRAEVRIKVPEEFAPDIVTLKLNGIEVSKTLLPQGYIVTYPTVVSDTDRLSMDMYVRGDEAATAEFGDDGKLVIKAKNKYIREDDADAE